MLVEFVRTRETGKLAFCFFEFCCLGNNSFSCLILARRIELMSVLVVLFSNMWRNIAYLFIVLEHTCYICAAKKELSLLVTPLADHNVSQTMRCFRQRFI